VKIGVISDTHIPKAAVDLPEAVYKDFVDCDFILHAGDLVEIDVLNKLEKLAPVRAVQGNMDMRNVKDLLPKKDIIEAGKFKIGLIHGCGHPRGLIRIVKSEFKNGIDAIVFGHSHMPVNERVGKTLFFNPGSPTDTIFAPYRSYGILEVNSEISGKIIRI